MVSNWSDKLYCFRADVGFFSTGQGLAALSIDTFRKHFQITAENEIIGDVSRVSLLNSVGKSFLSLPEIFGETGRPGNLVGKLSLLFSTTTCTANSRYRLHIGSEEWE